MRWRYFAVVFVAAAPVLFLATKVQHDSETAATVSRRTESQLREEIARLTKELERATADVKSCTPATPRCVSPDVRPAVAPTKEPTDHMDARSIFVGDPTECEPWTYDALLRLPPGKEAPTAIHWSLPMGLAYTVAPTHCLHGYGWTKDHMVNVSAQYKMIFFLHSMKTGGTSVRSMFGLWGGKSRDGPYCGLYNTKYRVGDDGNITATALCLGRYNSGHLLQFGYQHKFPQSPFFGARAFFIMAFRDPLMRALSVYDYLEMGPSPKEELLMEPLYRDKYFQHKATFWATDVFWYLGVERIRWRDSLEERLRKLEQCKFVIRTMLPLISERPLESHALMSVVLGGHRPMPITCTPLRLNEKYGNDTRMLGLEGVTKRAGAIGMIKMRFARTLYEYAYTMFELRLRQFGIDQLLRELCTEEERRAGRVGLPPELLHMDDVPNVIP